MTNEVVFDDSGTAYNGDLIVSFNQSVYRVGPLGTYSLIIRDARLKNYEGLLVVPNDTATYGGLAGKNKRTLLMIKGNILIPQTAQPDLVATQNGPSVDSAGSSIACIAPDLSVL